MFFHSLFNLQCLAFYSQKKRKRATVSNPILTHLWIFLCLFLFQGFKKWDVYWKLSRKDHGIHIVHELPKINK